MIGITTEVQFKTRVLCNQCEDLILVFSLDIKHEGRIEYDHMLAASLLRGQASFWDEESSQWVCSACFEDLQSYDSDTTSGERSIEQCQIKKQF